MSDEGVSSTGGFFGALGPRGAQSSRRRNAVTKTALLAFVLLFLLVACSQTTPPPAAAEEEETSPSAIARLEIKPEALLLVRRGESATLSAYAFDQQGDPVAVEVTWRSSDPQRVEVDQDGVVTARTDGGSALITAQAGGVASPPVLVLVATPVPGAVLISDAQVAESPELIDATQPPDLGSHYRVVLTGIAPPDQGTILLGAEGAPIAGRVVSASPQGGNVEIVLELVPLTDLFDRLLLDEAFDLSATDIILAESAQHATEVRREANGGLTLLFDIEDEPGLSPEASVEREFRLGPFKCKAEAGLSLSGSLIEIKIEPGLTPTFVVDIENRQLQRLMVELEGSISATMTGGISLTAAVEAKLKCRAVIYTIRIPIGGPISAFLTPIIPIGLGADLGATLELASLEFGLEGKAGTSLALGFDYQANTGLREIRDFQVHREVRPLVNLPNIASDFRAIGDAYFYGFAELAVGALTIVDVLPGLDLDLSWSVLEATFGPRKTVNLSFPRAQAANADYASDYRLRLAGKAGLGKDVSKLFELAGGGPKLFDFSVTADIDLARSPTGTLSSDIATAQVGEDVTFTVSLAPENAAYPLLGYNVTELHFYRAHEYEPNPFGHIELEFVDSVTAEEDQLEFNWTWVPEEDDRGSNTFFGFVTTRIPLAPLQIDKNAAVVVLVEEAEYHLEIAEISDQIVNEPFDVTVTLVNDEGEAVRALEDSMILLIPAEGSGTLAGTLSMTLAAGESEVVFEEISYDTAEAAVVLLAFVGDGFHEGLEAGSNPFDVTKVSHWTPFDDVPQRYSFWDVWGSGRDHVFAVGIKCSIIGSCDSSIVGYNGFSWFDDATQYDRIWNSFRGVWGSSPDSVFAVGHYPYVLHFSVLGWSAMTRPDEAVLEGVWGNGYEDVWAVGHEGTILHFDGLSWQQTLSPTSEDLYAVWGSGPDNVFAVGDEGTILRFDGTTWNQMARTTNETLRGLWGTAYDNVFAVGDEGTVLHFDGLRWAPLPVPTDQDLYGIWGSSAYNVFAVGGRGTILYHNGTTWQEMETDTSTGLRGVWGSAGNHVFVVGNDGTILLGTP